MADWSACDAHACLRLLLPRVGSSSSLFARETSWNLHGSEMAFHRLLHLLKDASLDLSNALSRDAKFTRQFLKR
jgi:hypothetical protein